MKKQTYLLLTIISVLLLGCSLPTVSKKDTETDTTATATPQGIFSFTGDTSVDKNYGDDGEDDFFGDEYTDDDYFGDENLDDPYAGDGDDYPIEIVEPYAPAIVEDYALTVSYGTMFDKKTNTFTGTYTGQWEDGMPSGEGTFYGTSAGNSNLTYTGSFENGAFNGYGEATISYREESSRTNGHFVDGVYTPTIAEIHDFFGQDSGLVKDYQLSKDLIWYMNDNEKLFTENNQASALAHVVPYNYKDFLKTGKQDAYGLVKLHCRVLYDYGGVYIKGIPMSQYFVKADDGMCYALTFFFEESLSKNDEFTVYALPTSKTVYDDNESLDVITLVAAYLEDDTDYEKVGTDYEMDVVIPFEGGVKHFTGTYQGKVLNGMPNGEGYFSGNGDDNYYLTYEGSFKDGRFDGYGEFSYKQFGYVVYEFCGTFKDGRVALTEGEMMCVLAHEESSLARVSNAQISYIDMHKEYFPTANKQMVLDLGIQPFRYNNFYNDSDMMGIIQFSCTVEAVIPAELEGFYITRVVVSDADNNKYSVYYFSQTSVTEGSTVTVYGLPLANGYGENCIVIGAYIE